MAGAIGYLPGPIESCIENGTCTVGSQPVFANQAMSAFSYLDSEKAGFLLRYQLYPTSTLHEYSAWYETDPDTGETGLIEIQRDEPLGGAVWLQVNAVYALDEPLHEVTLYLDRVTADAEPLPRWGGDELYPYTLQFGLSSDALLAGRAHRTMELDDGPFSGDLVSTQPLAPCLADGCGASQRLNLIFLSYQPVDNGLLLTFAGVDSRPLLYREDSHYRAESRSESLRLFNVQAPLPATGWLLLTAMAATGLFRRRRQ